MTCGIYKITNKKSGKVYIGSSRVIEARIKSHFCALRGNRHRNIFLQRAFNRDGESVFEFCILVRCREDQLIKSEQKYLDSYESYKDINGYNICKIAESVATHGLTESKEYAAWCSMISRCERKNHPDYKNIGAMGIKVCLRWMESFENFYEDMGKRPDNCNTLCRKDMTKNYDPSNCEWTTMREKVLRNRRVKWVILNGKKLLYLMSVENLILNVEQCRGE